MTSDTLDKWRVWPRFFITMYGLSFYQVTNWFMSLPDPSNAQSGFVSVVVTAGAGFFGIYVNGKANNSSVHTNITSK